MPEDLNIEVAHHLSEKEEDGEEHKGSLEILEILEALLLAVVTIATAWSGYQAARWDGRNALLYGEASKQRLFASRQSTTVGAVSPLQRLDVQCLGRGEGSRRFEATSVLRQEVHTRLPRRVRRLAQDQSRHQS